MLFAVWSYLVTVSGLITSELNSILNKVNEKTKCRSVSFCKSQYIKSLKNMLRNSILSYIEGRKPAASLQVNCIMRLFPRIWSNFWLSLTIFSSFKNRAPILPSILQGRLWNGKKTHTKYIDQKQILHLCFFHSLKKKIVWKHGPNWPFYALILRTKL